MSSRTELEKTVAEYEAVFQELARRRLDKFCQYVMPEYEIVENIHKPIINLLERIANWEVKKAIINMPPRAGKSQLISQLFPAYILGKYPNKKIVTASYERI